jgi:hypothetical protein
VYARPLCLNVQKVAFFVLRKRKAQWAAITDPKATADLLPSSEDGSMEEAPVRTGSRAPDVNPTTKVVENGAFAPQKLPQKSNGPAKPATFKPFANVSDESSSDDDEEPFGSQTGGLAKQQGSRFTQETARVDPRVLRLDGRGGGGELVSYNIPMAEPSTTPKQTKLAVKPAVKAVAVAQTESDDLQLYDMATMGSGPTSGNDAAAQYASDDLQVYDMATMGSGPTSGDDATAQPNASDDLQLYDMATMGSVPTSGEGAAAQPNASDDLQVYDMATMGLGSTAGVSATQLNDGEELQVYDMATMGLGSTTENGDRTSSLSGSALSRLKASLPAERSTERSVESEL